MMALATRVLVALMLHVLLMLQEVASNSLDICQSSTRATDWRETLSRSNIHVGSHVRLPDLATDGCRLPSFPAAGDFSVLCRIFNDTPTPPPPCKALAALSRLPATFTCANTLQEIAPPAGPSPEPSPFPVGLHAEPVKIIAVKSQHSLVNCQRLSLFSYTFFLCHPPTHENMEYLEVTLESVLSTQHARALLACYPNAGPCSWTQPHEYFVWGAMKETGGVDGNNPWINEKHHSLKHLMKHMLKHHDRYYINVINPSYGYARPPYGYASLATSMSQYPPRQFTQMFPKQGTPGGYNGITNMNSRQNMAPMSPKVMQGGDRGDSNSTNTLSTQGADGSSDANSTNSDGTSQGSSDSVPKMTKTSSSTAMGDTSDDNSSSNLASSTPNDKQSSLSSKKGASGSGSLDSESADSTTTSDSFSKPTDSKSLTGSDSNSTSSKSKVDDTTSNSSEDTTTGPSSRTSSISGGKGTSNRR